MLRGLSQSGGHGEAVRAALNLSIDVSPYHSYASSSVSGSDRSSSSPAPSSARASIATTLETPQSAIEWHVCYVLCLYDFESDDPDHLSFKKNEILDIVQKEETGWWAALRAERVGWVPSAFVNELTDAMAEHLRFVEPRLRIYEFHAERAHSAEQAGRREDYPREDRYASSRPKYQIQSPSSRGDPSSGYVSDADIDAEASPINPNILSPRCPPSPATPMPQPPFHPNNTRTNSTPRVNVNKPTPPTPKSATHFENSSRGPKLARKQTDTAANILNHRTHDGKLRSAGGLTPGSVNPTYGGIIEVQDETDVQYRDEDYKSQTDVEAYINAKAAQSKQPWYLEPTFGGSFIELDYDGNVNAGTVEALVERLTIDPLKLQQEILYRQAFLSTFHTFTTADDIFALLADRFNQLPPNGLSPMEVTDWKEKKLRPTQHRVLTVLMIWLEDFGMLKTDPHIMPLLRDFLGRITQPPPLVLTASLMLQSLSRLECAQPIPDSDSTTLGVAMSPILMKRRKSGKSEFLRMDANDIAQQLTLLEHRFYSRIRPQECYSWAKVQKGEAVKNLISFCATHDKLASWVKMSVLSNDGLGKRADTIDMWIKIAEKCRNINNFSSMVSIVTALSSQVIARLHLTWSHVGRGSHLEPMTRLVDPKGNFTAYRTLHRSIESTQPCVPFIAMYLTDMMQISEHMPDTVPAGLSSPINSAVSPSSGPGNAVQPPVQLVCFLKRQRWYEGANSMMRHQGRSYLFAPNGHTSAYIDAQLSAAAAKDQGTFWQRSQEVQQAEVAHADLRKGLEEAGF